MLQEANLQFIEDLGSLDEYQGFEKLRTDCAILETILENGLPVLPSEVVSIFRRAAEFNTTQRFVHPAFKNLMQTGCRDVAILAADVETVIEKRRWGGTNFKNDELTLIFDRADRLRPSHAGFQNLREIEHWLHQELAGQIDDLTTVYSSIHFSPGLTA
jgi:hypothetical protein